MFLLQLLSIGIVGIILMIAIMIITTILSLYLSGKILKSINDEFISAIKTFGWCTLTAIIVGGINFLLTILSAGADNATIKFILGLLGILIAIGYLIAIIFITKKIYDFSILKTILMLILAGVMDVILTGILGTIIFIGFTKMAGNSMESFVEKNINKTTINDIVERTSDKTETGIVPEENTQQKPRIPTSEDSQNNNIQTTTEEKQACSRHSDCNQTDELCWGGLCQKTEDIEKQYVVPPNCGNVVCDKCENGKLVSHTSEYNGISVNFCAECNPNSKTIICKDGFTCKDYKCIAK